MPELYVFDELEGIQMLKLKRNFLNKTLSNTPEKSIVLKFIDKEISKMRSAL